MKNIDFTKIGSNTNQSKIEPRDIFMSLPSRKKEYQYPRDVQSEVWKKWFDLRNSKNCIIKMNTGSGKTVVGLIILKSCLNEGKGPAVYVVPDNYLVEQVCEEANNIGIKVTKDENDADFKRREAILIINIKKLINGKSIFGMRQINNINIGSIIIDDVHACLSIMDSQYTILIPNEDNDILYSSFIKLFSESMKAQSNSKYSDIVENQNPYINMLIPFWDWQNKIDKVHTLLNANIGNDYLTFNYPLLKECLHLCNCVISSNCIEITPKCIPIHNISSFIRAERRIFMSATLSDDSVFISALGLTPTDLSDIISPEKANDIGDRLILFPQVINKNISDNDIKIELKKLSLIHNVVVIVPSYFKLKFWKDVADLELNSDNINPGIQKLKSGHVGLVVLINKYDGINLPDDACRILVIDGLPNMRSQYDCFEQNANPNNKRICSEQIQKIEQGMGRGVRSNTDYCVIVLMGNSLVDIIYAADGYEYFSDATKQQFDLSTQLWKQIDCLNIDEIMKVSEYSLSRNLQWISFSKDTLSNIKYNTKPNIDSSVIAIREAFDSAEAGRYQEAVKILTSEKDKLQDAELKGLFKQFIAEYTNFINPIKAQEILLSASKDNRRILKPIEGIQFEKVINKTSIQSEFFIKNNIDDNIDPNIYIMKLNSVLDKLIFAQETANLFEASLRDLSFLLGIFSNRPEDEYGNGPDNFWDIGDSKFMVIECKNGTITDTINKSDCNQLNGSINWFKMHYRDNSFSCFPIMIHNSKTFNFDCSPDENIRIMTPELLMKFKANIVNFSKMVVNLENFNNPIKIQQLLNQFNLNGTQIVTSYTVKYKIKTQ